MWDGECRSDFLPTNFYNNLSRLNGCFWPKECHSEVGFTLCSGKSLMVNVMNQGNLKDSKAASRKLYYYSDIHLITRLTCMVFNAHVTVHNFKAKINDFRLTAKLN